MWCTAKKIKINKKITLSIHGVFLTGEIVALCHACNMPINVSGRDTLAEAILRSQVFDTFQPGIINYIIWVLQFHESGFVRTGDGEIMWSVSKIWSSDCAWLCA